MQHYSKRQISLPYGSYPTFWRAMNRLFKTGQLPFTKQEWKQRNNIPETWKALIDSKLS